MAIKQPRGYSRQPIINFQEISKGERPAIDLSTAIWLPVIQQSTLQGEWHVILAGTICSLQGGRVVPANGGVAQNVTYTVNDVGYTYDIDNTANFVTAAGAAANQLADNRPVGWSWHHMFSDSANTVYTNYSLQPHVSTLNDYMVQVPLLWDEQYPGAGIATDIMEGWLVRPLGDATWAKNGAPVRWVDGTDTADQIAGRCLRLETISVIDNLNKIRTVSGLGLSGDGTNGIEHWLVATREDGTTAVSRKATIAIDLL